MADVLGSRMTFGVITPSTNTIVQPEYDSLRPEGVTNHISRMVVGDAPILTAADLDEFVSNVDSALDAAVDAVLTCRPDHLVLGVSAESVWGGGLEPSRRIRERVVSRADYEIEVTQASDAIPRALEALGVKRKVSVLTPYASSAEPHIRSFFEAIDMDVVTFTSLAVPTPIQIAHVSGPDVEKAFQETNHPDAEAIVQFGANFAVSRLIDSIERAIAKPVVSVNTATYWWALRRNGIDDIKSGFGRLFDRH